MAWLKLRAVLITLVILPQLCFSIDTTQKNRRRPTYGLPDWSQAGYLSGRMDLPDDSMITLRITKEELQSQYQVIPDDGQDDSAGLQKAIDFIKANHSPTGGYNRIALIELPSGQIDISQQIYVDASWLLIRGQGTDPTQPSSTRISFKPNSDTIYDTLSPDGSRWDPDSMLYSQVVTGSYQITAKGGWIWPGRGVFRVQYRDVAPKFQSLHEKAPPNRKDLLEGSVNFHWKNDKTIKFGPLQPSKKFKGYMVDQTVSRAGIKGDNKLLLDPEGEFSDYHPGVDLWVGVPVTKNMYDSWGVVTTDYHDNQYMLQDIFTITAVEKNVVTLNRPLAFDVWSNSVADGSPMIKEEILAAKALPLAMVRGVGLENFYLTQTMPEVDPASSVHNYANLSPAKAIHGIVLKWAADSWVKNIRTYMTGSHPIVTESCRNLQIQNNYLEGSWNKGKGGNGYLRGSRVWDSLFLNNTLRRLRHFTFQWSAMRNVAALNNMDNDLNLHGGVEAHNLLELNTVNVPAEHSPGRCAGNTCGGESGDLEEGTWYPIWWGAGEKASKWSGATGPQNVFFRNTLKKQMQEQGPYLDYQPYYSSEGSSKDVITQFGWDTNSRIGMEYKHLRVNGNLLANWGGFETQDYAHSPNEGVNNLMSDSYKSLFFSDVPNVEGLEFCNNVNVKMGYYFNDYASNKCSNFTAENINPLRWTHVNYGFAKVKSDGSVDLSDPTTTAQLADLADLKVRNPKLKLIVAVGGWNFNVNSANFISLVHSNSKRKIFINSFRQYLTSGKLNGLDIEFATGVNREKFVTFITELREAFKDVPEFSLTIATSFNFWRTSPTNVPDLVGAVNYISITPNLESDADTKVKFVTSSSELKRNLEQIRALGVPREKLLMGLLFFGMPYKLADPNCHWAGCAVTSGESQSMCVENSRIWPYYEVRDLFGYSAPVGVEREVFNQDALSTIITHGESKTDIVVYDDIESIKAKANLAKEICLGGVSVWSIDQDGDAGDLFGAINEIVTKIPTPDQLIQDLMVALNRDGTVPDNFWDVIASRVSLLVDNYSLSQSYAYQLLLLASTRMYNLVTAQLEKLLSQGDLSADKFAIYKKWTTISVNRQLHQLMIGDGRQFWSCKINQSSDSSPDKCPTSYLSPVGVYEVTWDLINREGFESLLVERLQVSLNDLELSTAYYPIIGGCRDPGLAATLISPNTSASHVAMKTRVKHRTSKGPRIKKFGKRSIEDPFVSDPFCELDTHWNGMLRAKDSFFENPEPSIQEYIQTAQLEIMRLETVGLSKEASLLEVMTNLEEVLVTITSGSHILVQTYGYIAALDEALEAERQQLAARNTVESILLELGLTLIGFAIGPVAGLVGRGIMTISRTVGNVLKTARVARGGKAIQDAAKLEQTVVNGFTSINKIKEAVGSLRSMMTPWVRKGYEGAKKSLKRVDDTLKCKMGPKAELIFDITSDLILGSIVAGLVARDVIGISSPQNSSLSIFPKIDTIDAPALVAPYNIFGIQPFAESKKRCPWESGYRTSDFRKGNIETHCKKQDDLIFIPPLAGLEGDIPDIGNGNNFKSLSDSGYDVQCDHMVELQEILNTLRGLRTSNQQLVIENEALTTELCNEWNSKKFDEKLFNLANSKENTRGAYGTVNNMKRTLMAWQDIQLSNMNANKQVVGTLERYLNDIEVPRQKFARTLNTKLRDEMISQLTTQGLSLEGLDFARAVNDNMERAKRGTATLKISVADISRPTNDSNIKNTHREPRIGTKRNQKRACAYTDNYNESTDSGSDMDTSP